MKNQSKSMQDFWWDSYLTSGNESYLEELYETYLKNPGKVTPEWRQYFNDLSQQISRPTPDVSHEDIRKQFLELAKHSAKTLVVQGMESYHDQQQERVIELIAAYRRLG